MIYINKAKKKCPTAWPPPPRARPHILGGAQVGRRAHAVRALRAALHGGAAQPAAGLRRRRRGQRVRPGERYLLR